VVTELKPRIQSKRAEKEKDGSENADQYVVRIQGVGNDVLRTWRLITKRLSSLRRANEDAERN